MNRDSLNRVIRTLLQAGVSIPVVVAFIAFLRALGLPISADLEETTKALIGALLVFVAATGIWNGVESATGKSVLKE